MFTHSTMHVLLDTVAQVGLGENNETQAGAPQSLVELLEELEELGC